MNFFELVITWPITCFVCIFVVLVAYLIYKIILLIFAKSAGYKIADLSNYEMEEFLNKTLLAKNRYLSICFLRWICYTAFGLIVSSYATGYEVFCYAGVWSASVMYLRKVALTVVKIDSSTHTGLE